MECNYWDEKGLLYMAGELDEKEMHAFDDHLETCDVCQKELQLYREEKKSLFMAEMFEEAPSPAVDNEIIRVCSQPIKPAVTAAVFPSFVKNTIFALLILAIGFGGGAYFVGIKVASDAKKAEQQIANEDKSAQEQTLKVAPSKVASGKVYRNDSLSDSIGSDSAQIFKRGNLDMQGVVPVDLLDK